MSLDWYFRLAERWHPLGIALALVLLVGSLHLITGFLAGQGEIQSHVVGTALIGTELMFVLLPTYMLSILAFQGLHARQTLNVVREYAPADLSAKVAYRIHHLHPLGWIAVLAGFLFGLQQNQGFLSEGFVNGTLNAFDFVFALGNCSVWMVVALHLSWRIPLSVAFSRLGAGMAFDVYQLHRVRPLARMATLDILVVAGAVALIPLQSLDLEFRWYNYSAGIIVAVPAAVVLFLLPLIGPRRRIVQSKVEELARVEALIDQHDRSDVVGIEALAAHMERLRSTPSWPIDIRLLTRVFFYGIIAPLAWVAAALVEQMVESVT